MARKVGDYWLKWRMHFQKKVHAMRRWQRPDPNLLLLPITSESLLTCLLFVDHTFYLCLVSVCHDACHS